MFLFDCNLVSEEVALKLVDLGEDVKTVFLDFAKVFKVVNRRFFL